MRNNPDIKRLHEVLDYSPTTGVFIWKKRQETNKQVKIWNKSFSGKVAGYTPTNNVDLAKTISIDNKPYRQSRVAWAFINGEWPEGEVDHINLNPLDNSIANLRLADRSQNECNKKVRADNKLGVKGVHYDKDRNKYMVQLKFKGIRIIRRVKTLEAVKELYASLVEEHHGEFGRVN